MEKPNIIYFLSDQHNFNISGFMGDPYVKTPNFDQLAENGTVLDQCYCNSPLCVPSRSSMLSGLLPSETGILNNMQMLPSDRVTMAHSLTNAGYETVLCGRMHFSGLDQRHGFSKRLVGDITSSFPGVDNELEMYGYLRGTSYQGRVGVEKVGKGSSAVLKFDEAVIKAACSFLHERDKSDPLFLLVGTYAPHCPYVAYEKWFDYYMTVLPDPALVREEYPVSRHPAMQKWIELRDVGDITNEQLRRIRAAYYALITFTDENFGKVLAAAKQTLDMENTVIVYTSDHGDNAGEHGLFWKTNFYEGASRVPAVISWPGRIKKHRRLQALTSLVDIAPTFIDIAGAQPLPHMDGISLLPYLESGEEPPERSVISILGDIKGDNPSAMIRKGDYKLVLHYGYDAPQLFDLKNDPHENNDLGTKAKYRQIISQLSHELAGYWNGEEANEQLRRSKAHYEMLRQWINRIGWTPVEEWEKHPEDNYING